MNAEKISVSNYTVSFGLSLAMVSIANALLVIVKERNKAVMDGMKRLTGHHWTAHSALMVALFFILGWALAKANGGEKFKITSARFLATVVGGVVLGSIIIVGFYLLGD